MSNEKKILETVDGETLMDMYFPPTAQTVEGLIPQGLTILGGSPKIGKSWMALDLCLSVAKGDTFLGRPSIQGTAFYLCLEDTLQRVRERLNTITDDVPPAIRLCEKVPSLENDLVSCIRNTVSDFPDTRIVVVDTFQKVRKNDDVTYANDYADVASMKALADELKISVVLIHHLRKLTDTDPFKELTGSTGLTGAADALIVLKRSRCENSASLICTGRDICETQLGLSFGDDCRWHVTHDGEAEPEKALPDEMQKLAEFVSAVGEYRGGNEEFANRFNEYGGYEFSAKALKQQMNKWQRQLENLGVQFRSGRSNGQRYLAVSFLSADSDASDVNDAENTVP